MPRRLRDGTVRQVLRSASDARQVSGQVHSLLGGLDHRRGPRALPGFSVRMHIRVRDHGIAPMLKVLGTEAPVAVARALNKVALDVREAEARMVGKSFDFWSATTRQFLANERSFPFETASSRKLWASVMSSRKTSDIMTRQEFGFTLRPRERKRLTLGSQPASYAIPTDDPAAHLRTPRGRVPGSMTPGALLRDRRTGKFVRDRVHKRRKRGQGTLGIRVFVTPRDKAIIEVTPTGERRLLYWMYSHEPQVAPHTTFYETADRVVDRNLVPKVRREVDRIVRG